MAKKIIWAIIELITIAIGTGIFVTSTLDADEESAGIGAFMVVLGLLLKNWRKDLFSKQSTKVKIEDKKESKLSDKNLMVGVLLIFASTLWGLNYGDIDNNESDINTLENKVDDLESNSHYH